MMPPSTGRASDASTGGAVPIGGRWTAWLLLTLVGLVLGAYLLEIARHGSYDATDSDISGYLNLTRQLRAGVLVEPLPRIDGVAHPVWDFYFQQPLGYRVSDPVPVRAPTYPVGYPLHLLVASYLVGETHAGLAVALVLCLAAAGLMVAVGRELGLAWSWSAISAALLLACPLFLLFAMKPMSDVPATVWTLATVWCALRARRLTIVALASGFAFGIAVLVRPSNAVLILPLAVLWGFRWRLWLAFALGGLPLAAFQAWYNLAVFGSIVTTGYGNVSDLFRMSFVPRNTWHFAWWTTVLLSPVLVAAACTLGFLRRTSKRVALMLTAWAIGFAGFYAFYFYSGESWWFLRFILPMFPAVILAAALAGQALVSKLPRWPAFALAAIAAVMALGWQAKVSRRERVFEMPSESGFYARTVEWMRSRAPENAIVLQMQLSGCFTYYTNFTVVRWDLISSEAWQALQTAARTSGRPLYATVFEFESERCFERVPGPWRRVAELGRVTIWELAP